MLICDGHLQPVVTEWIRNASKNYEHVVEMSDLPSDWGEWSRKNLNLYSTYEICDAGESHERKTRQYCIVRRLDNTSPLFMFLKSNDEKELVLHNFPDLIVNASPFKTVIE